MRACMCTGERVQAEWTEHERCVACISMLLGAALDASAVVASNAAVLVPQRAAPEQPGRRRLPVVSCGTPQRQPAARVAARGADAGAGRACLATTHDDPGRWCARGSCACACGCCSRCGSCGATTLSTGRARGGGYACQQCACLCILILCLFKGVANLRAVCLCHPCAKLLVACPAWQMPAEERGARNLPPTPYLMHIIYCPSDKARLMHCCMQVRLLYVVARERDDPRVVPHVAWARKALQSLLAANAPDRQRRRRRDLAIEDVHPTEEWPSAQQRALSATGELSSRGTGLTLSGGLSSLSPQLLVDLLYVVAQLGLETRPGQGAAVRRLCSCLHHVREQLSPGNLASVLVCLAVLKRRPAPSFVHAIFTRVSSLLERFSPQELANAITASGYLGLQPGEELLRQITRRLRKYDLVQLAMFVRKLEQATPRDSAEWLLELRDTAKNLFASKA